MSTQPLAMDLAYLSIGYGPAESGKRMPPSINGSRTSHPARRCGSGLAMTRPAGRNFAGATLKRSTRIPNNSAVYVPWQDKARSRSCTRLTTSFITTPLRSGACYWDRRRAEEGKPAAAVAHRVSRQGCDGCGISSARPLRYRKPGEALIEDSLHVVDSVLKVDTPFGARWRRYNHDG